MYVEPSFYSDVYKGSLVPETELDSFLSRSSDAIDQVTFFRIRKRGFDKLSQFQQRQVKLAICVQADFMKGIEDMPEWVQSYSNISGSVTRAEGVSSKYSTTALAYLKPTNLLYRGLGS